MFNKIKVKSTLKNVIAIDDGEFFLGAEPYLWPVYFKIDGSEDKCSVDLKVEIDLLKPPLFINDVDDILKINGESSVNSFDDNIFTSYGNLRNVTTGIEGWLFGDNGVIIPQDGLSDNTEILNPMPLNISLEMKGFDKYKPFNMNLSEIFKDISDSTTRCEKIFKHLDKVDASFVFSDVIPGIMGSIYILREQDTQLDNTHIEKARKILVTEIKEEIDKLISSISLSNFDFSEDSMLALQKRLAKNVEDKTLASFDSWDWTRLALRSLLEAMAIIMITGGAAATAAIIIALRRADADDGLISLVGTYSHLDFGNDKEFSFRGLSVDKNFEPTGVDGEWELNGNFTVEDGSGTSSNINKIWEGEWNSSYGKITLTQNNNNITGDYTNVAGTLLGETTASDQLIEGNFTNPVRGKNGSFEFWYRSSTEFIGKWKWDSDTDWRDEWNGWK